MRRALGVQCLRVRRRTQGLTELPPVTLWVLESARAITGDLVRDLADDGGTRGLRVRLVLINVVHVDADDLRHAAAPGWVQERRAQGPGNPS